MLSEKSAEVVNALGNYRKAWEVVADEEGMSLLDVKVSLGYTLADLAMMLGLTCEEQEAALGPRLYEEFNTSLHRGK